MFDQNVKSNLKKIFSHHENSWKTLNSIGHKFVYIMRFLSTLKV